MRVFWLIANGYLVVFWGVNAAGVWFDGWGLDTFNVGVACFLTSLLFVVLWVAGLFDD